METLQREIIIPDGSWLIADNLTRSFHCGKS